MTWFKRTKPPLTWGPRGLYPFLLLLTLTSVLALSFVIVDKKLFAQRDPKTQTIETRIEYRAEERHLHLDKHPTISKSGGSVLWKVHVTEPGAKVVQLWFPDTNKVFDGPRDIEINLDSNGRGEALLTLTSTCALGTVPFAVYCDLEGPQFGQPGRQMVDGAHSHPECNVGP